MMATYNFGSVYIYGCQFLILKGVVYFCLNIIFTLTNSIGSGEMRHHAAFHLGLHCLQNDPFRRIQYTTDVL